MAKVTFETLAMYIALVITFWCTTDEISRWILGVGAVFATVRWLYYALTGKRPINIDRDETPVRTMWRVNLTALMVLVGLTCLAVAHKLLPPASDVANATFTAGLVALAIAVIFAALLCAQDRRSRHPQ